MVYVMLLAVSVAVFVLLLMKKIVKPVSRRNQDFLDGGKKAGRTAKEYSWVETRDNLLKKISVVKLSPEFREEMNKDLNRLGIDYEAEDIRRMQILYTVIFVSLALLMFYVNVMIGIFALVVSIFVWNVPVKNIKDKIRERNDAFIEELPALYTVIYNQYKRTNEERLGNIIESYIPSASYLMASELKVIMQDIEYGEDAALRQLKHRIPSNVVMRFCDIIANNLEGVKNVEVMENFYMELKGERTRRRQKWKEQKAKKLDFVVFLLTIPFFFIVVVYLVMMTVSNFV